MKKHPLFRQLAKRLKEPHRCIHVILGPRQVGKTTLALQVSAQWGNKAHYISANLATLQDPSWLYQQWNIARKKKGDLFIIDDVQNIPHWSERVKALWDEDTKNNTPLKVILLGPSPWLTQKELSESLPGRFEIIPATYWSFPEMHTHFGYTLEDYLFFGGYPGAVPLCQEEDPMRWMDYINDALIKVILSRVMTQVNKPSLLRRLFHLGCTYSGQILSYSKMLGELQDAGNVTTLSHYLELLEGAGLLCGLQKYANQTVRQRGSPPKFMVFNTALMTAQGGRTPKEVWENPSYLGRVTESAVGAHLLNSIRGTPLKLFYWRERNQEVDFVLQRGDAVVAIEVKSSDRPFRSSGMEAFRKQFHPLDVLLVGEGGIPLKEFLTFSPRDLF